LDAVIVCVPDEYHDQISIDACEAGCDVLVEKPMAMSVKAAERMISASRKAGRLLMVGYMKRYDPGYGAGAALMKEASKDLSLIRVHDFPGSFASGSMNEVIDQMVRTDQVPKEKQEEGRKRTEDLLKEQLGNYTVTEEGIWRALLAFATHDMSILRGAFGDPKGVLTTTTVRGIPSKTSWMKIIHTTILSMLDYGEAKCIFEMGGPPTTWFDEELIAYFTNQTISIRFPYPWIKNEPTVVKSIQTRDGGFAETCTTSSYQEAFKLEHVHFLECIRKRLEPTTSGNEGRKDLEFLYNILEKFRREKT
jgi:predicted dehydrogenase